VREERKEVKWERMIREEGFYLHLRACAGIGGIWLLAFPLVLSLITTEKEERTQQPRPSNFAVIQIPTGLFPFPLSTPLSFPLSISYHSILYSTIMH